MAPLTFMPLGTLSFEAVAIWLRSAGLKCCKPISSSLLLSFCESRLVIKLPMFPKFALADKEFEEGDNEVCLFAHGLGPKVDVAEENDVSAKLLPLHVPLIPSIGLRYHLVDKKRTVQG